MKKSRLLGAVHASIFTSCFLLTPNVYAVSILLSDSGGIGGYGYGYVSWDNMTAALDAASGNNVDVTSNFENLTQMLSYDALFLDQRWTEGSLTATEISNISSFIDTGRRVVMMGENSGWTSWNNQILGIVGGSFVAESDIALTTVVTNEITAGVTIINVSWYGIASGGTALFDSNAVTLWGAGNVLTLLDVNVCDDGFWSSSDNATFCGNVASWIATSAVPVPAAVWLFSSGLLGLIGISRRKKAA